MNRRRFVIGALAAAGLVSAGGVGWAGLRGGGTAGAADGSSTTTTPASRKTAKVTKRDLVQTESVGGRLGYGDTRTIGGGPDGTVTQLPAEGTVLQQGDTLWEVDGAPGPALLFGAKPLWRPMSSGVDEGEDVRQLEENLVTLGFADPAVMTVDGKYTSATAAAVKRWQKARGLAQTGTVAVNDAVFAPAPVRVAALKVAVGDKAGGAPVLDVTGAEQVVTVPVDTSKAGVARQGDPVTIELDDGRSIDGSVRSVGTVVHSDSSQGQTSNYLDVVVAIDGGQAVGLDDAPVTVNFVRSSAKSVLAVPVRALLALAEGGYALEKVVTGTGTELVGVQLGSFADGYVEVSGSIAEGDTVVVA